MGQHAGPVPIRSDINILVDDQSPPPSPPPARRSRPVSNLTLPPATLESLSRVTTQAASPCSEQAPATAWDHPGSAHPFSPFYSHPQTRTSYEQLKHCSVTIPPQCHSRLSVDVEKGLGIGMGSLTPAGSAAASSPVTPNGPSGSGTPNRYSTSNNRASMDPSLTATTTRTYDSTAQQKGAAYVTVWPAGDEVRQRKKWARRQRGCVLFRGLTRKQKIWVKICIAILVIGLAVAIGCAISYKTGGVVWRSANQSSRIGE